MHHWGPTHPDVSTLNIYSCLHCVQGSVNFVISISILHNHDISSLSWGTAIHLVNPSVKLITDYICTAISNFWQTCNQSVDNWKLIAHVLLKQVSDLAKFYAQEFWLFDQMWSYVISRYFSHSFPSVKKHSNNKPLEISRYWNRLIKNSTTSNKTWPENDTAKKIKIKNLPLSADRLCCNRIIICSPSSGK